jgi:hypothetical protein
LSLAKRLANPVPLSANQSMWAVNTPIIGVITPPTTITISYLFHLVLNLDENRNKFIVRLLYVYIFLHGFSQTEIIVMEIVLPGDIIVNGSPEFIFIC